MTWGFIINNYSSRISPFITLHQGSLEKLQSFFFRTFEGPHWLIGDFPHNQKTFSIPLHSKLKKRQELFKD